MGTVERTFRLNTEISRGPFFNSSRNILAIKSEKHNSENRRYVSRKTPHIFDEWNGYPEYFILLI